MTDRRHFLTLLGAAGATGLAGCGGNSDSAEDSPTVSESPNNSTVTERTPEQGTPEETPTEEDQVEDDEPEISQREQSIQEGLPLEGLGAYEDQMLEAGPVEESTAEEIENLLEGASSPEEEADRLSEMLTDENFGTRMAEFYRQKEDSEDTVVVNENYGFFQDSGPILEIYTVENGELQSGPILSHTSYGETSTQAPGDGENPQYLHDMRESSDWAQVMPQDYRALTERIEPLTDKEKRNVREDFVDYWSAGLFGLDETVNIIPHDGESSNVVFDGLYHDGDTQAVVELNNEYRDSELFDSDTVVSAEYTGDGWEFHERPEYEMGDKLPGE